MVDRGLFLDGWYRLVLEFKQEPTGQLMEKDGYLDARSHYVVFLEELSRYIIALAEAMAIAVVVAIQLLSSS
jgi:hypothetical protein